MLQAETIVGHPEAENFTDENQHQHIEKYRERIALKRPAVG